MSGAKQELDRLAVRRAFNAAAHTYDKHAVLQVEVANRLLERLDTVRYPPERILDLGCGTGRATRQIKRRFRSAQVIGIDFSRQMLEQLRHRSSWRVPLLPVCADLSCLPFADRSVDLVFSSLALQWLDGTVEKSFGEIRRVLKPDGLMLFSSFGPQTLTELHQAWMKVDSHPHVNQFVDMHELGDMLTRSGFQQPVLDSERFTLTYRKPIQLLQELKAIGAHNSLKTRSRHLTTPRTLQRLLQAYEDFRQPDQHYPATYEVIYGIAFGVNDGQPVRDHEGETATFSLEALRAQLAKE